MSRLSVEDPSTGTSTAWNQEDRSFTGVEIKAQSFVDYAISEDGEELWVERCGDRQFVFPRCVEEILRRYVPLDKRPDPEKFRLLNGAADWHWEEVPIAETSSEPE